MSRHIAASSDHQQAVARIIRRELGERARDIRRMTAGIANEVYAARLSSREVIVRLNADSQSMRGSPAHIALFRSLGIPVPELLAADYSKSLVPFAYQIQSRLDGVDLGHVIEQLSEDQLKAIAREIAAIVRKLEPLPTNGRFGWTGGGEEAAFATWLDLLQDMRAQIAQRDEITRVVGERRLRAFDALLKTHRSYLSRVPSTFYFDDMSSKNVMVADGRFVGLVDLDTVAYGDPLEGIGRIEASWFGAPYGRTYADAVMAELDLTAEARRMVSVYATLNRIYWLSERGFKFNANTSTQIDPDAVKYDEAIIDQMLAELGVGATVLR
jgi:aminoglycoside phosphotransferase (APT) family kinase protein